MIDHVKPSIVNVSNIWLHWVLANGAAGTVAMLAVLPLVINLAYARQDIWLIGAVGGAGLGLALGAVQWWLLRRIFLVDALWIALSVVGGALGLAIGMLVADYAAAATVGETISRNRATMLATGSALNAATGGLLFGLLLGLGQWLLLRRRVDSAACWIIANAVGWTTALGLAALVGTTGAIGWLLVAGLINGVLTGRLVQRWATTASP
ncbi:MAG: hypothetical protein KDE58_20615 [Caldilineaceae bacterium]|nr:hypothetical protein [Caldilineaceae bacterium]